MFSSFYLLILCFIHYFIARVFTQNKVIEMGLTHPLSPLSNRLSFRFRCIQCLRGGKKEEGLTPLLDTLS